VTRPLRRIFPGRQNQVACARDFVRRAVGPGCPVLDEAILLTSELCTNAQQHTASGAGGSFEVTVFRRDDSLRVEVRDEGASSVPAVRSLTELSENGRGLEVVHLIADRWGQSGDRFGRIVFFELRWRPATQGQHRLTHDPDLHPRHYQRVEARLP